VKSILDRSFKYRSSATHGDPEAFRRRMRARIRIAQRTKKKIDQVIELKKERKHA
jgi:hypothetical protein